MLVGLSRPVGLMMSAGLLMTNDLLMMLDSKLNFEQTETPPPLTVFAAPA